MKIQTNAKRDFLVFILKLLPYDGHDNVQEQLDPIVFLTNGMN